MSAPRRILLAPAGSPDIGGGHVMRAVALAQALSTRGGACTLAVNAYGASLAARFDAGQAVVHPIDEAGGPAAVAAAVAAARPDVLVIDDYAMDAEVMAALKPARPHVAVIDDLADRRHLCELLVDPGYGRMAADYAGLVPKDCQVLTGPAYALLRQAFEQDEAPAPPARDIERVFVSLGLSDVDAVTATVVQRLAALAPTARIDVALSADAGSLASLRALASSSARLTLHVDARDVAGLMRAADVAVGAGGASTWERCAFGLPSLAVIVADNQRRSVRALEADGVLLACDLHDAGFARDFDEAWRRLLDADLRASLTSKSRALCDGRGAARVAEAILRL